MASPGRLVPELAVRISGTRRLGRSLSANVRRVRAEPSAMEKVQVVVAEAPGAVRCLILHSENEEACVDISQAARQLQDVHVS